jgi:hypothetical protein
MKFKINDPVSIKEVDDYGTIKYKGIIKSIIRDYYVYVEITDICHKKSSRYPTRQGATSTTFERIKVGDWEQFVLDDLTLELQEMRDNKLSMLLLSQSALH